METIKFRGKGRSRRWFYGYYGKSFGEGIITDEFGDGWIVSINTVGQFTGLIDKNGKEIYEGDILSNSFMDNKKGKNGIVSFKEHCFCVECEELFRPIGNDLGWANMNENKWYGEIEVIGNIYDNPELVEQP